MFNQEPGVFAKIKEIRILFTRDFRGDVSLTLISPEYPNNCYSLFGNIPKEDDNSDFAIIYRRVGRLLEDKILDKPWGEDHPLLFHRFNFRSSVSIEDLISRLNSVDLDVDIISVEFKKRIVKFGKIDEEKRKLKLSTSETLGVYFHDDIKIICDIKQRPELLTNKEKVSTDFEAEKFGLLNQKYTTTLVGRVFDFIIAIPSRIFCWIAGKL